MRPLETENNGRVNSRPVVMVVDDFERALEPTPKGFHCVKDPNSAIGIAALISAFATRGHDSRLLFTSRFKFTCMVDENDAADRLQFYQLPDMAPAELQRQALQLTQEQSAGSSNLKKVFDDLAGAVEIAFGSPSLMSKIVRLRVESEDRFQSFRKAVDDYRKKGKTDEQELLDFLEYLAIDELLDLLSGEERELLRRSTLFEIPAPLTVLPMLHRQHAADPGKADNAARRLLALGLLNRFENPLHFSKGHDHALVDPIVRPKLANTLVRGHA